MTVKARDARMAVPDQVLDELRPRGAVLDQDRLWLCAPPVCVEGSPALRRQRKPVVHQEASAEKELAKSRTLSTISAVSGPLAQSMICW